MNTKRIDLAGLGLALVFGVAGAILLLFLQLLLAGVAHAQEAAIDAPPVTPPDASPLQRSLDVVFTWINTPSGRFFVVLLAIVLLVDGMRKSWPQLRRRLDGSIASWASAMIWIVCVVLGQLAAMGGLLAPFTGAGKIGDLFAGLIVSGTAVGFNEVISSTIRKLLQLFLTRYLGANAPQVELTPGPGDVPPGAP